MWQILCLNVLIGFSSLEQLAASTHPADIGIYPNADLTPGETLADITSDQVCMGGYAKNKRFVSKETKIKVRELYGIKSDDFDKYSIDHFVPLCLGGSNDLSNLWPQKKGSVVYGVNQKMLSDHYLFQEVCQGRMSLKKAQKLVKSDWIAVYKDCCQRPAKRKKKYKSHKPKKYPKIVIEEPTILDESIETNEFELEPITYFNTFDLLKDLNEDEL